MEKQSISETIYAASAVSEIPMVTWLAVLISIVALLASITQVALSYKESIESRNREHLSQRKSVDDHFWIREVVVPKCVIPSIESLDLLVRNSSLKIPKDCYRQDIRPTLNAIRDNFLLAAAVAPSLGEELSYIIDDIDDVINEELNFETEEPQHIISFLKRIKLDISKEIILIVKNEQMKN